MKIGEELRCLERINHWVSKMPREARLRTLAYLSSRELEVGTWSGAEILYGMARVEREASQSRSEP